MWRWRLHGNAARCILMVTQGHLASAAVLIFAVLHVWVNIFIFPSFKTSRKYIFLVSRNEV